MVAPRIQYPDNESAARAVYRALQTRTPPVRHLALQPAGRQWSSATGGAAFDEWRMVPANTPGSHRHGRLVLRRVAENPLLMSAGFGVTRGLGRQLAELADPVLMMDDTWFWRRRLVGDVFAGTLDALAKVVSAAAGQPPFVTLQLIRFDTLPEAGGIPVLPHPADRLVFRFLPDTQRLSPEVLPEHELSPLATSPTLRDLILHTEAHPDLAWAWIDFHLGIHLAYGNEDEPGAWDAQALWTRVLAPWLPWVH